MSLLWLEPNVRPTGIEISRVYLKILPDTRYSHPIAFLRLTKPFSLFPTFIGCVFFSLWFWKSIGPWVVLTSLSTFRSWGVMGVSFPLMESRHLLRSAHCLCLSCFQIWFKSLCPVHSPVHVWRMRDLWSATRLPCRLVERRLLSTGWKYRCIAAHPEVFLWLPWRPLCIFLRPCWDGLPRKRGFVQYLWRLVPLAPTEVTWFGGILDRDYFHFLPCHSMLQWTLQFWSIVHSRGIYFWKSNRTLKMMIISILRLHSTRQAYDHLGCVADAVLDERRIAEQTQSISFDNRNQTRKQNSLIITNIGMNCFKCPACLIAVDRLGESDGLIWLHYCLGKKDLLAQLEPPVTWSRHATDCSKLALVPCLYAYLRRQKKEAPWPLSLLNWWQKRIELSTEDPKSSFPSLPGLMFILSFLIRSAGS